MKPEDLLARLEAGYEYDPMYGRLCNERDQLKADNAKLKAENAKLLEIIADLEKLLPKSERLHIHETANAIADDNAKLRKLVRDMWKDACQFDGFWDYVNDDGEIYNEDELPHYQERMRELGVEP